MAATMAPEHIEVIVMRIVVAIAFVVLRRIEVIVMHTVSTIAIAHHLNSTNIVTTEPFASSTFAHIIVVVVARCFGPAAIACMIVASLICSFTNINIIYLINLNIS